MRTPKCVRAHHVRPARWSLSHQSVLSHPASARAVSVCLLAGRESRRRKEEEEEEQEEGVRFTEGRPVGRRTTTKQIDARVYEKE